MKNLIYPDKKLMDMKSGCVRCWWPKETIYKDGHYRMFGGMVMPTRTMDYDTGAYRIIGYAMVAGLCRENKTVYIFDDTEWSGVDHVLNQVDGSIQYEGIVSWLNSIWAGFYARTFALRQDDDTQFQYRKDFSRCAMVEPKPVLFDAQWDDPAQPMAIIGRANQLGRLKYKRSSIIFRQLEAYRADADPEKHDYPAVHALKCCMSCLERFYMRD